MVFANWLGRKIDRFNRLWRHTTASISSYQMACCTRLTEENVHRSLKGDDRGPEGNQCTYQHEKQEIRDVSAQVLSSCVLNGICGRVEPTASSLSTIVILRFGRRLLLH